NNPARRAAGTPATAGRLRESGSWHHSSCNRAVRDRVAKERFNSRADRRRVARPATSMHYWCRAFPGSAACMTNTGAAVHFARGAEPRIPGKRCIPWQACARREKVSGRADFLGLQPLLTLHHAEAHFLAFLQGAVPRAGNGTEMDEHIRAGIAADKAESLGIVEPLDGADLTIRHG